MTEGILFVDTSALVALSDLQSSLHRKALDFVGELLGQTVKVVTSFLVLGESASLINQQQGRAAVEEFLQHFERDGIQVLATNETIRDRGQALFREKIEEKVNFVDCLKVALMHYYGAHRIFSFDEGIDQFDVVRVPK